MFLTFSRFENPVVFGSLSMYPSTVDNYGIDSCSIMCMQTTPPIVVIAMCTGKIYHAILLREILDDDDADRKVCVYGHAINIYLICVYSAYSIYFLCLLMCIIFFMRIFLLHHHFLYIISQK